MMATAPVQALASNRFDVVARRAVKQDSGRRGDRQFQIDFDAVALIRSYMSLGVVNGEALLIAAAHDFIQFVARNREMISRAGLKKGVDCDPAAAFQLQSDAPGRMTQMLA